MQAFKEIFCRKMRLLTLAREALPALPHIRGYQCSQCGKFPPVGGYTDL